MKKLLSVLLFFGHLGWSHAATAEPMLQLSLERSWIDLSVPMGTIRNEVLQNELVPLQSQGPRQPQDPLLWREWATTDLFQGIPFEVSIRWAHFVTSDPAQVFYSVLRVDGGANPQLPSGWTLITRDLNLKSWITTLKPTEFLQIDCRSESQCAPGGQGLTVIWRVRLEVFTKD